ncbi:MAG: tetratricopeptide repeat protein, partial [Planctomycetota bacterium]
LAPSPRERRKLVLRLVSALCNGGDGPSALDHLEKEREFVDGTEVMEDRLRLRHLSARVYSALGRHEDALNELDDMEALMGPEVPVRTFTAAFSLKANLLTHLARYDEARALCEARLDSLESGEDSKDRALVLDCLAFLHRARGELKESLTYQKEVHHLSEQEDDKPLAFQSADGLSVIYSLLGDNRESLKWGRLSVRLAEDMDDLQAKATAYGNYAIAFTSLGRVRTALKLFKRANRISERIGDIHKFGVSFFNIANVLDAHGLHHKSTGPYLRCIELAEKVGDRVLAVLARACFAWHQLFLWDADEAEKISRHLEGTVEELANPYVKAMCGEIEARILFHRGRLFAAGETLKGPLRAYEELGHTERILDCRILQGRIAMARGDYEGAEEAARGSADMAREKGMGSFLADGLSLLGEIRGIGDSEEEGAPLLTEAAALFRKLGWKGSAARVQLRLVCLLAKKAGDEPASLALTAARALVESVESEELEVESEYAAALVAASRGNRDEARGRLERAVAAAEKADAADLLLRTSAELAGIHEEAGKVEGARVHYRKAEGVLKRMSEGLEGKELEDFLTAPHRTGLVRSVLEFFERDGGGPTSQTETEEPPTAGDSDVGPLSGDTLAGLARLVERSGDERDRSRFDELRSAVEEMVRLLELVSEGPGGSGLDRVLSEVLGTAIEITDAQRGFVILNEYWGENARPEDMQFAATRNFDHEKVR